jgi:hypothetical protein
VTSQNENRRKKVTIFTHIIRPARVLALGIATMTFVVPAAQANDRLVDDYFRDAGDATAAKLALQSSPLVIRDAGDATAAKLALQSSPLVIRDAGDATAAKLALQSSPLVIRDAGDATAAKLALQSSPASSSPEQPSTALGQEIDWAQLGIGFGVGMFILPGVILAVRFTRSHRLAH